MAMLRRHASRNEETPTSGITRIEEKTTIPEPSRVESTIESTKSTKGRESRRNEGREPRRNKGSEPRGHTSTTKLDPVKAKPLLRSILRKPREQQRLKPH
jgi:hypothetical protein